MNPAKRHRPDDGHGRALTIMQVWLWCSVPVFAVLAWLVWRQVPIRINHEPLVSNVAIVIVLLTIASALARLTPWRSGAVAFQILGLTVAALPLTIIIIYGLAWHSRAIPLRDSILAVWDQHLGFDWLGYLHWLRDRPQIARLFETVYRALAMEVLAVPLLLCLWRLPHRALQFLAAFLAALVLCGAIAAFVPATGAYYFYGIEPRHDHPLIALPTSQLHVPDFLAMRAGAMDVFSVEKATGIVSFPSFHTAAAIIFTWSLYSSKMWRWPAIIWNGIMLVATPIYGGHYFVDMIAGAGIALAGILAATWLWALAQQRAVVRSSTTALADPAAAAGPGGRAIRPLLKH